MPDPVELRKIISSRLAIARQNSGLSQAQVAKQINLPRPSITEIEAGRRRVSVEEIVQFADLYQVDLNWLSGQDADQADPVRDKLQLAARHVADLKSEDLEKVIELLISLRVKDTK